LSLLNQSIPPTAGTTVVDPEIGLDVVLGEPRNADLDVVLSNSFGFGGHNGSVVFRRYQA
ncbi:MAG TPA: beta-ketoacyl-ACP synthase, partial [Acidimicrobiales bacterium]